MARGEAGRENEPVPGSARVEARAPDPAGGPGWGVLVADLPGEPLSIDVQYDRTHLTQDDIATATAAIPTATVTRGHTVAASAG